MAANAAASTSRGEPRTEPEIATKKSRPKPKKKPPTGSIYAAPSAPPSDLAPTTITAPRTVIPTALPEPILPIESQPQDMPLTIADRAKSRVRGAKSKPVASDIIEVPSDEDERLLRLSPHRPRKKDVRGVKNQPIPNLPPPSIHPSQESLVVPTSDYQPALAVSSQLPPSDPPSSTLPLPTSTPESARKRRQASGAGDADESPLNLSRKRKRQRVAIDDGDNELHVFSPRDIATTDQPPNFFASSSSSLPPPPAPIFPAESRKKLAKRKRPTADAPLPEVTDPGPPKEKKGRPKPRKKSGVHPEPSEVVESPPVSAPGSRPRSDARDTYKSAEIIVDSDEEAGPLVLPPPPRLADSQSPLSDLSEPVDPGPSKSITPSSSRKRLIPEVLITTVPRKRSSSPPIQEAEVPGNADKDGANGGPKGKKRQKKAAEEDYFEGLDDEPEVVPKKGSRGKGKGKAPPKGKGKTKPQHREVVDDEEFEEDPVEDAVGTGRKAKSKVTTKATKKTKSVRSGKSRVVDSDDEVPMDPPTKDSDVVLVDSEQTGDSSMAQKNTKEDETTTVSLNSIPVPETVLICGFQEGQENTPPRPKPVKSKSNPTVTPSSVSRKTPAPSSVSSFVRLNYGHSLASEEKPASMAEIIKKANSATGTPSGIKSYSSFMKGSRSVLRKIAPLHARRKTPPPLPPKPPPPKKTKKQLELEEKWEEELEETIEGWGALSSQEREVLRKQKRDMEMGYGEDW